VAIEQEKPLLGQPLNDVISWQRTASSAGCYCEPGSRKHKWGLVLETVHFALVERERKIAQASVTVV
jgi:pyruvoyl-dependent arginine decarboxylase (PvlArgDC)